MKYTDFNKDFVQRTIEILEAYDGPRDVTLLINCLTGLLILPKENCYDKIPDDDIEKLGDDWGIKQHHITEVRCTCCGYKLKNVVRQLRNSVAHMKVKTYVDGDEISELEFKDSGFKARIPIKDLKQFVIKLATTVT